MSSIKKLTLEQIAAIGVAIKLGKVLQQEMPEIAEDYRKGLFLSELSKKHQIESKYRVNKYTAKTALRIALAGNELENIGVSFPGLIKKEEMEILAEQHHSANGKRNREEKKGFWGWNPEKIMARQISSGYASYESRAGVHARSGKDREEDLLKAILAKDMIPWAPSLEKKLSEKEYLHFLGISPTYTKEKGVNLAALAKRLNDVFHKGAPVRTKRAVQVEWSRIRKSQSINKTYKHWKKDTFVPEKECAYQLTFRPEFQHTNPQNKGQPHCTLIAAFLNEEYHENKEVRTASSVTSMLGNYKKALRNR